MSKRIAGERKQRTRRFVIVGTLVAILSILAFVPAAREGALDLVRLSEQLKDAQGGAFATVAVVIFVIFAIVENAEKLHFIWEMGHKLLGYDLESMERHEREFTDLPDDYTRRPKLEKDLVTELAPLDEPKLVVFLGAHDTGKTTTLHYVIPRKLNRAYKGRIVLCSGDLQGIEGEVGDTDEQLRRRLAKRILRRVIQHAEVPGDIGETIESMREEITEHFLRGKKRPWLIIIDQIDASRFPYSYLLPALFGQCNTVLLVGNHVGLDERMLTISGEDGEETVTRRDVHIIPFTVPEALEMLSKEVRKRRGGIRGNDRSTLRPLLKDTMPGAIQRLSDIYVSGGVASVTRVLDPSLHGMRRTRVIANSVIDQYPPALKRFIAALALLEGEQVSEPELNAIAETDQCKTMPLTDLIRECGTHGYLELVKPNKRQKPRLPGRNYTITKLGRGIANVALHDVDHESELQIGAALLQFYRGRKSLDAIVDSPSGLRNVLGMMTWAERTSRLPNRDVVRFIRKVREALYYSGNWDAGFSWLQYAEGVAVEIGYPRSIGEFRATLAQLLMAVGRMQAALRRVTMAREAFGESSVQSESDLRLGIADAATLQASLDYDALQQCWLAHLEIAARVSQLPAQPRSDELENLVRLAEEASLRLQAIQVRLSDDVNRRFAAMIAITLDLDTITLALQQSDVSMREHNRGGARRRLESARSLFAKVRESAEAEGPIRPEMRAHIEFTDAALSRMVALESNLVQRVRWRARAKRRLVRCLEFVEPHSLEGALMLMEGARLALMGVAMRNVRMPTTMLPLRRIATRFSPRWHRLRAARSQLLSANSVASALGAEATQVGALLLLVTVAGQLMSMEGNAVYLRQSGDYARSALAISERLRDEMPNLLEQARALPDWAQISTPVRIPPVLVD